MNKIHVHPRKSELLGGALLVLLRLAVRLLARDWRGGGLTIVLVSLVLAVATVTSISLFNSRIHNSIHADAAQFMAADVSVKGSHSIPVTWAEKAQRLGLRTASSIGFSSMLFSENNMALAEVKAVSEQYPLLGTLELSQVVFGGGAPVAYGPKPGELWIAPRLFDLLALSIGDTVSLGDADFILTQIINREPDQGQSFFGVAPRVMININDVPATNTVQPGSRINYALMLAGSSSALSEYQEWLSPELGQHHQWVAATDANRSIGFALQRAEQFLLLAGSLAVILGGAATALAARRYALEHVRTVVLLKTIGNTPRQISIIFIVLLLLVGVFGIALGSVLGWLMHWVILAALQSLLVSSPAAPSFAAYLMGAITGLVSLLAFAAPPLLHLRKLTPAAALNHQLATTQPPWQGNLFALLAVLILLYVFSRDIKLTMIFFGVASLVLCGVYVLSQGMIYLVTLILPKVKSGWRLGLKNIQRHRQRNAAQIMVFSLLFMLAAVLFAVRTGLIDQWQQQLPENAANHFAFNIQPDELAQVKKSLASASIAHSPFYPMTRGRVLGVNGIDVDVLAEQYNQKRINYQREMNLSSSSVLAEDNKIVAGSWWVESSPAQLNNDKKSEAMAISVEQDFAHGLNIAIGDVINFSIAGQAIDATVASIRTVQWDSMKPNFFVLFEFPLPSYLGSNWLTSFYLAPQDKNKLNVLAREFPTLTFIELDQTISQLQNIMSKISSAVEFILLLVLASGLLVLVSSIQATLDVRMQESAILRTIGADKKLVRRTLLIEFSALGFTAGVLAVFGTELALYLLQTRLFNLHYEPFYWLWLVLPLAGGALIALVGWLSTRRVLQVSPMSVLRS